MRLCAAGGGGSGGWGGHNEKGLNDSGLTVGLAGK